MFFDLGRTGRNEWWMYFLGFLIVAAGYIMGQFLVVGVVLWKIYMDPNLDETDLEIFSKDMDFSPLGINSNLGLLLLLMMFVLALLALIYVVKNIHQKKLKDLITFNKINWGKILFGFALWFGMALLIESVSYYMDPSGYEYTFNLSSFLPLLLIAIFILPLQTSFEELLFRGYLMQGFGLASSHKWIPLAITSVAFGLIHMFNPEVREFGVITMMFYYVSAGLFLGILTIMDDSLELALGVHAATNMYGTLMVGYNGSAIKTDSILKTNDINPTLMTGVFIISAVLFYIVCSKKYNWNSISKIFEPINIKSTNEYA